MIHILGISIYTYYILDYTLHNRFFFKANKSKTILTDINNRHTDHNTKEEVSNDSGRFKRGDN